MNIFEEVEELMLAFRVSVLGSGGVENALEARGLLQASSGDIHGKH